jgi:hypothetical protein
MKYKSLFRVTVPERPGRVRTSSMADIFADHDAPWSLHDAIFHACPRHWEKLLASLARLQAKPRAQTEKAWQKLGESARQFEELAGWHFSVGDDSLILANCVQVAKLVEQY